MTCHYYGSNLSITCAQCGHEHPDCLDTSWSNPENHFTDCPTLSQPPGSITLNKFAEPIDPAQFKTVEADLQTIDPALVKEIVNATIAKLGLPPYMLNLNRKDSNQ